MVTYMAKMGRKSLRDEVMQSNVINLSWTTIHRALRSKTVTIEEKRKMALEIVKKTCPQEMNHTGDGLMQPMINILQSGEGSAKYTDRVQVNETCPQGGDSNTP